MDFLHSKFEQRNNEKKVHKTQNTKNSKTHKKSRISSIWYDCACSPCVVYALTVSSCTYFLFWVLSLFRDSLSRKCYFHNTFIQLLVFARTQSRLAHILGKHTVSFGAVFFYSVAVLFMLNLYPDPSQAIRHTVCMDMYRKNAFVNRFDMP